MSKQINVALIGNPNTGKTSVFNSLPGLNQKVGNYPGIKAEQIEGICKSPRGVKAHAFSILIARARAALAMAGTIAILRCARPNKITVVLTPRALCA